MTKQKRKQPTVRTMFVCFLILLFCGVLHAQNKAHGNRNKEKTSAAIGNTLPKKIARESSKPKTKARTLSYRERLERAVLSEAEKHRIDPLLIWALIEKESAYKPTALSPKGARGVMQLMPGTARRWGVKNPHNIEECVKGGSAYLVWLIDKFKGNVALGLAGYNAGEGAVEAYLPNNPTVNSYVGGSGKRWYVSEERAQQAQGIPQNAETINYVYKIAEIYRRLKDEERRGQKVFITLKDVDRYKNVESKSEGNYKREEKATSPLTLKIRITPLAQDQ